ncbi:MAG: HAD family hydrolase, partial [Anaerolineae bacterium]|nr:HAD family hydrolase [Anaerolineae bacterium]
MIKAVFLDLDNTLLYNPDDIFAPEYLSRAEQFFAELWGYTGLAKVILQTIRAMSDPHDRQQTNSDVAVGIIAQATGKSPAEVGARFAQFYQRVYPLLRDYTRPFPIVPTLVKYLQALELKVTIATNPLYPAEAIRQRLDWAGLPDELSG